MERKEIECAVEAILFASGEPLSVKRLCEALELARPAVGRALETLLNKVVDGELPNEREALLEFVTKS